jgi:hypothetical protein
MNRKALQGSIVSSCLNVPVANCEDWPESGSESDTFRMIDDLDNVSQPAYTQDEDNSVVMSEEAINDLSAGTRWEGHGALSRTLGAVWTSKAEITSSTNELRDSSRHGNNTVTTTMVGDLAKYPAIDPLTATRHHLSYDVSVEVGFDSLKNPGHKCFKCRHHLFSPIQSQLKKPWTPIASTSIGKYSQAAGLAPLRQKRGRGRPKSSSRYSSRPCPVAYSLILS